MLKLKDVFKKLRIKENWKRYKIQRQQIKTFCLTFRSVFLHLNSMLNHSASTTKDFTIHLISFHQKKCFRFNSHEIMVTNNLSNHTLMLTENGDLRHQIISIPTAIQNYIFT